MMPEVAVAADLLAEQALQDHLVQVHPVAADLQAEQARQDHSVQAHPVPAEWEVAPLSEAVAAEDLEVLPILITAMAAAEEHGNFLHLIGATGRFDKVN